MRERLRPIIDRLRIAARVGDRAGVCECRAVLEAHARGRTARQACEVVADAHAACLARDEHEAAAVLLDVLRRRPPPGGPWLVVALAHALELDGDEARFDELERLATCRGPWLDVRRDVYADALLRLERTARARHRWDSATALRRRLARLATEPVATPHQRLIAARSQRDCD